MDLDNIMLKSVRRQFYLLNNSEKIEIKIPTCTIPFGIETYNNKNIINCNIDITNNNIYNLLGIIIQLENYLNIFKYSPYNFKKSIENKKLYSNIKKNENTNNQNILRCHLKKNTKILNGIVEKNTKCSINLEIGNIWITEDKYGIILYINEIIIL
jgi:hypothetical protein